MSLTAFMLESMTTFLSVVNHYNTIKDSIFMLHKPAESGADIGEGVVNYRNLIPSISFIRRSVSTNAAIIFR